MKKVAVIVFEVGPTESVESILRRMNISSYERPATIQEKFKELSWREKTQNILAHLGINNYYNGYTFIVLCMEYLEAKNKSQKVFLKDMYSYITEKTGENYGRIDSAIRFMCKKISEFNTPEKLKEVLGIVNKEGNLKNSILISAIKNIVFDSDVDVESLGKDSFSVPTVEVYEDLPKLSWRKKTQSILAELGINSYLEGYKNLLLCMEYVSTSDRNKKLLAREVYGYITLKTGAAYTNVERNIRSVREKIYELNSLEKIQQVLGIMADGYNMTNLKFVTSLADRIFGI